MKINSSLNKKIALWGYGLEGKSALNLLLKKDISNEIIVFTNTIISDRIDNVKFISENDILEYDFDILIKSPGVSFYRKEIEVLQDRGVIITSILNILLAEVAGLKSLKTIAVTGTKGKSTTASLCCHMLESFGFRSALLGNIGVSFLDVIETLDNYDYLVLELSSCQLKNISYELDYGVLLNLFPEHIDWHKTHKNYYIDKLNILKYSRKCFVNYDDPLTIKYIGKNEKYKFFNSLDSFHVRDNFLCYNKDKLFNINSINNIEGEHIFTNMCGILSVFHEEKLNVNQVLESLQTFKTLPHRLEIFCSDDKKNTKFVDDSISTIPEATIEALKTFKNDNIFLILGGFDREQDYSTILEFIKTSKNIKKVFLLGQTGRKIANVLENSEYFDDLESLVKAIKNYDLSSMTVLLSPAAASFDMFTNFRVRGDRFKELMLPDNLRAVGV